jgi:predicted RNase H-like HicB family nuclease
MQYQVFIQSNTGQHFVASVVGIPNVSVEGATEAEAIAKLQTALKAQLATGKFVTIEVDVTPPHQTGENHPAGIFANDPTFDDWMEKLATIRQAANAVEADR